MTETKKRTMNVSSTMLIDHTKDRIGDALSADYKEAKLIALQTVKFNKASEAIEDIMFNHNVPMQTRFLAVFIAGTLVGGNNVKITIEGKS